MEEEITLEYAKICAKKYVTKKRLQLAAYLVIGIAILTMFVLGCVFINYWSLAGLLMPGAIGLGFAYVLLLPNFIFRPIKEEQVVVDFLNQERKKIVYDKMEDFTFDVKDAANRNKLLKERIDGFLSLNPCQIDTSKTLEEQLKFTEQLEIVQKSLNYAAEEINRSIKQEDCAVKLDQYIDAIKDRYYPSEYELICQRRDEWKRIYNDGNLNIFDAKTFCLNKDNKTIATAQTVDEFEEEYRSIMYARINDHWQFIKRIKAFNSHLMRYIFERRNSLLLDPYRTLYELTGVRYLSHCWNCGELINEDSKHSPQKCEKCGGFHCRKCGACLCGYKGYK